MKIFPPYKEMGTLCVNARTTNAFPNILNTSRAEKAGRVGPQCHAWTAALDTGGGVVLSVEPTASAVPRGTGGRDAVSVPATAVASYDLIAPFTVLRSNIAIVIGPTPPGTWIGQRRGKRRHVLRGVKTKHTKSGSRQAIVRITTSWVLNVLDMVLQQNGRTPS